VLLRVSEVNLARARKRFDEGEYDSAVFHASMAIESAANAMIIKLGGDEAKNHRVISGLAAVLRRVKPELLKEERYLQLISKGTDIQREVVHARYPLKVAGKWVTPMEYYTREKAHMIINNAKFVVDEIKEHFKRAKQEDPKGVAI
jgi:HEPN domain-containing protein